MKKLLLISTYPAQGSQNVGDLLIVASLKKMVSMFQKDVEIDEVYRADNWDSVREHVDAADHIVFSCLAIRESLRSVYPYIERIFKSGKPFSAISSGASFPTRSSGALSHKCLPQETVEILLHFNANSCVFTTRDYLTQELCELLGLHRAEFAGDIAFFDERFDSCKFKVGQTIKKILISDPHYARDYMACLDHLYKGLKDIFPDAYIAIAQHGRGDLVEKYAASKAIEAKKLYLCKEKGLEEYNDVDLHVGFRVHGHVSALKRRKYSYLLEQDDRGVGYGLTLNNKISVTNLRYTEANNAQFCLRKILRGRRERRGGEADTRPVHHLLALIKQDRKRGFCRFLGMENQINAFNRMAAEQIMRIFRSHDY